MSTTVAAQISFIFSFAAFSRSLILAANAADALAASLLSLSYTLGAVSPRSIRKADAAFKATTLRAAEYHIAAENLSKLSFEKILWIDMAEISALAGGNDELDALSLRELARCLQKNAAAYRAEANQALQDRFDRQRAA